LSTALALKADSSQANGSASKRAPAAVPNRQHPLVIQLRRYAQHFGDFEGSLLEAAQKIHRQSTCSDATMRLVIVAAIAEGCNAVSDLVDETGLDEVSVRRIYADLIADGEYEERPMGQKIEIGRGRRPKGIFLKSEPAGNSYSNARNPRRYENPDSDDDDDYDLE